MLSADLRFCSILVHPLFILVLFLLCWRMRAQIISYRDWPQEVSLH